MKYENSQKLRKCKYLVSCNSILKNVKSNKLVIKYHKGYFSQHHLKKRRKKQAKKLICPFVHLSLNKTHPHSQFHHQYLSITQILSLIFSLLFLHKQNHQPHKYRRKEMLNKPVRKVNQFKIIQLDVINSAI